RRLAVAVPQCAGDGVLHLEWRAGRNWILAGRNAGECFAFGPGGRDNLIIAAASVFAGFRIGNIAAAALPLADVGERAFLAGGGGACGATEAPAAEPGGTDAAEAWDAHELAGRHCPRDAIWPDNDGRLQRFGGRELIGQSHALHCLHLLERLVV